jgi:hypothetical protein
MPLRPARALGTPAIVLLCLLATSSQAQLPLDPLRDSGQSVTPAFEGWYQNPDGTYSLLVGYFNRNLKQTFDIPVGPDNRIEPGGPDMGQPTHFDPRRGWGVFTLTVPKDFADRRLTWTIVANGKPESIPVGVIKDYQVEPFKDAAMGNTPPTIRFSPTGKGVQGPPTGIAHTLTAAVGNPLTIEAWLSDDMLEEEGAGSKPPPLTARIALHRGPADVTFSEARPKVDLKDGGKITTTVTFAQPGEYVLRVQANDATGEGGGGFQCCWTNAYVGVTVK